MDGYTHTQKSPLSWLLLIFAIAILLVSPFVNSDVKSLFLTYISASIFIVAGLCFHSLTIEDKGDHLLLRFGPLPLFKKSFHYAQFERIEPDRSIWIDGWGIHYIPGRGMIYNIWGFDCIKLIGKEKTVRIGSNDLRNLQIFLGTKIPQSH